MLPNLLVPSHSNCMGIATLSWDFKLFEQLLPVIASYDYAILRKSLALL
jgi:hypothetical protein